MNKKKENYFQKIFHLGNFFSNSVMLIRCELRKKLFKTENFVRSVLCKVYNNCFTLPTRRRA